MSKYPIPHDALDDRLAWTGTSGTGKTYDSGTAIEKVLHAKSRACILDPLGVWWGLRLNADGKGAGFKVAIFGGPHGDIAITETSGKLIGETVAGTKESCIIDLSEFDTEASQRRFMLAFLVSLYGGLKGDLLHLVLDEADMWAPQRIMDKEGDATKLHHNVQKIVRRGRVKGFIPWLITQRPAELSKSVLSQVDGIVAHQLVAPQDVNALMDWVSGHADKATADAIRTGLPSFGRGEAAVYIPRRRVLAIGQFPKKVTFDSSRSPERGERKNRPDIALKPLDIDALKQRLEKVEAEAKANDPNALKAEIAKLKREKAELEKAKPAAADPDAIAKAEERGFERGKKEVAAAADKQIRETRLTDLTGLHDLVAPFVQFLEGEIARAKKDRAKIADQVNFTVTRDATSGSPAASRPQSPVRAVAAATTRKPSPAAGGDGALTGPQRQLLQSLAWWKAMGWNRPSRVQVAVIAGWRVTSGHIKNVAGSLRTAGLIDYPVEGVIALTPEGEAVAPAPDTSATLEDSVRSTLTGPQQLAFDYIPRDGAPISRDALAQACGWEPTSGHVKNVLGSMRSLEIIDYPAQGQVARAEWLRA